MQRTNLGHMGGLGLLGVREGGQRNGGQHGVVGARPRHGLRPLRDHHDLHSHTITSIITSGESRLHTHVLQLVLGGILV